MDGGYQCDGKEIHFLDKDQVCKCIQKLLKAGAESFAVIGVYSPMKNDQEVLVGEWIREMAGDQMPVCLSNTIGGTGFIERENAAILNAALKRCIQSGFEMIPFFHRVKR